MREDEGAGLSCALRTACLDEVTTMLAAGRSFPAAIAVRRAAASSTASGRTWRTGSSSSIRKLSSEGTPGTVAGAQAAGASSNHTSAYVAFYATKCRALRWGLRAAPLVVELVVVLWGLRNVQSYAPVMYTTSFQRKRCPAQPNEPRYVQQPLWCPEPLH